MKKVNNKLNNKLNYDKTCKEEYSFISDLDNYVDLDEQKKITNRLKNIEKNK
ncbi:MAG: hypothetical protein RSE41_02220 [Clostridia bacterium]